MQNKLATPFILLLCLSRILTAHADTTEAHFLVTAKIENGCRFESSTNFSLNFKDPTQTGGIDKAERIVELKCTPNVNPTISVNNGMHADKSGNRNLALENDSTKLIPYKIETINIVPKNQPAISEQTPFSQEKLVSIKLAAQVPRLNQVIPGKYTDTLIMTVAW